jgi:hypothetical protein
MKHVDSYGFLDSDELDWLHSSISPVTGRGSPLNVTTPWK